MTNIFEEQYLYGDNSMVDSCITSDDCILTSIGPRGEKGDTGARGPKGEKGDIGETGATGAQGPRGERGEQGPRGDIGPKGDTGAQGLRGPVGPEGPQGPQGIQGPTGATGAQGPQGIQGVRGPKGDIGPGFRLKGEVERQEDIVGEHKEGDCYFITSTKHVVIWTGSEWIDLGNIKGPQGEEGPTGPQGPIGATGPQGVTGATGPQGETGPQGPKGDVGEAAIIDSKISNVNTWSSKQIIDHLLQDNEWKTYDNAPELTDATNGYIRGLTIEGNTHEGQGVGLQTEKGYKIGVKTHGKNLLNTNLFYNKEINQYGAKINFIGDTIKIDAIGQEGGYINLFTGEHETWISEKMKTSSKFFKLKAGTYNYKVYGIKSNGQIKLYDNITKRQIKDNFSTEQFTLDHDSEVFLIYQRKGVESVTIKIQLEEGKHATSYQPYKESTSEIILDRQLMTGDKLTYDDTKGKYIITLANKDVIDTEIKAELLPQTYKNKTYISVDSGVKPTLKGEYPIDDFKVKIDAVLLERGLIQAPHTTLEEIEEDEPTTLEEFSDDPTTLEEV